MIFRLSLMLLQKGPEFAQNTTGRNATPTGIFDYLVVAVSVLIVLISAGLLVKHFLHPEEPDKDYIKHSILEDDSHRDS